MRMQQILFYRELDFPLKYIQMILSSPDYDKQNALKEQRHLLMLKKERLERLISALDSAMKGEKITMKAKGLITIVVLLTLLVGGTVRKRSKGKMGWY